MRWESWPPWRSLGTLLWLEGVRQPPSGILVPSAGLEPGPSSMKGQSRNQRTAREFARGHYLEAANVTFYNSPGAELTKACNQTQMTKQVIKNTHKIKFTGSQPFGGPPEQGLHIYLAQLNHSVESIRAQRTHENVLISFKIRKEKNEYNLA